MNFLGNLGIDVKLLIAQMVNFGLLLWLLSKFLYKPIVKKIEEDETELREAQIQKAELEREKKIFLEQKEKEEAEIKKRAREIIAEAELIAEKIRDEARQKAERRAMAIIEQSRNNLETLKPDIEDRIFKKMKTEMANSFKKIFNNALSLSAQKKFQNVFWSDLKEQIEKLTIKKLKEPELAEIVKKLKRAAKKKDKGGRDLEEKLEKIFSQKIGPVVIEYAHPPTKKQEKEMEEIIAKKMGIKIKISKKQNKDLINGFRFEIAGTVIESNLSNIIKNAANMRNDLNKTG